MKASWSPRSSARCTFTCLAGWSHFHTGIQAELGSASIKIPKPPNGTEVCLLPTEFALIIHLSLTPRDLFVLCRENEMLNCRTKRIALKKRVWFQLQPEILYCPRGEGRHRRDTCTHAEQSSFRGTSLSLLPRGVLWGCREVGAVRAGLRAGCALSCVCAQPEQQLLALAVQGPAELQLGALYLQDWLTQSLSCCT